MIERVVLLAREEHKEAITLFLKKQLPQQETYIDYFLKNTFFKHVIVLVLINKEIVALASANYEEYLFKPYKLKVGVIDFLVSYQDYLLEEILALKNLLGILKYTCLLTLTGIEAKSLDAFGFKVASNADIYQIKRGSFNLSDLDNLTTTFDYQKLSAFYYAYCRYFDAYKIINPDSYILNNCAYLAYQVNGRIQAYAFYHLKGSIIKISNMIFKDSISFKHLITGLLAIGEEIEFVLPNNLRFKEKYRSYFIGTSKKFIHLNNITLLSKLYQKEINITADFINLNKKIYL